MSPEARQHPQVQADEAQARDVVAGVQSRNTRPDPEASKHSADLPKNIDQSSFASTSEIPGARSKAEWDQRFQSWQKSSPVNASDMIAWKPSYSSAPELKQKMITGAQGFLDLLPPDVVNSLGEVNVEVAASLRKGVPAQYFPDRNTVVFSHMQMGGHNELQVRKLMWHEMAHWLFDKAGDANAHPHLKAWRAKIEQHWKERTKSEIPKTDLVEKWQYIIDNWINKYVGRLYPNSATGLELPSVYLEEAACGPLRLAKLCRDMPFKAQETFDIVLSLFTK